MLTGGWRQSYKLLKVWSDSRGGYREEIMTARFQAGLWSVVIGFLLEIWLAVWPWEPDKSRRVADTQVLLDTLQDVMEGKAVY